MARLRRCGILVVGSMILGFDYHTAEIIEAELQEILAARPTYLQCLLYGPTPGTTLWDRLEEQGRWGAGPPGRGGVPYERCDGFELGFTHPNLGAAELGALQRSCYERDLQAGGRSIFRAIDTWFEGWEHLRAAHEPWLRARARVYERKLRACRPLLPVGIKRAPNPTRCAELEQLQQRLMAAFGPPEVKERIAARWILPAAERWTSFKLRHDLLQQPRLERRRYRWIQ